MGLIVGYAMNAKKLSGFFANFLQFASDTGVTFVPVDFSEPRRYDAVIHKVNQDMILAKYDEAARRRLCDLEALFACYPDMPVLDPLPAVRPLLYRPDMLSIIQHVAEQAAEIQKANDATMRLAPIPFAVIQEVPSDLPAFLDANNLRFPLVCKSLEACSTSSSHDMAVAWDGPSLEAAIRPPLVVQRWTNHGAVVHKVYVIDSAAHITRKPSLRDLQPPDGPLLRFNSQLPPPDLFPAVDVVSAGPTAPLRALVDTLLPLVVSTLGLTLFGFDLIVHSNGAAASIIDINYFPAYDGFPDLYPTLLAHIRNAASTRKAQAKVA